MVVRSALGTYPYIQTSHHELHTCIANRVKKEFCMGPVSMTGTHTRLVGQSGCFAECFAEIAYKSYLIEQGKATRCVNPRMRKTRDEPGIVLFHLRNLSQLFAKRLERDWVVNFTRRLPRIMESDKFGGGQWLLCNWVGVVMLSSWVNM